MNDENSLTLSENDLIAMMKVPITPDERTVRGWETNWPTRDLDFGQALQAMRAGKWCTRPVWNGCAMTLRAHPVADRNPIRWYARNQHGNEQFRGGLYLDEILATDWEILP